MDDIKLPPLPYPQLPGNDYTASDMYEYARAHEKAVVAALQMKSVESAARELALWAHGEVGADPELTPGLKQLLEHFGISDDAPAALQSQGIEAYLKEQKG